MLKITQICSITQKISKNLKFTQSYSKFFNLLKNTQIITKLLNFPLKCPKFKHFSPIFQILSSILNKTTTPSPNPPSLFTTFLLN